MKISENINRYLRIIIVTISTFVVMMGLYYLKVFNFLEKKSYDQRMVFASRYVKPDDNIYFIGVDQNSIEWAKETYGWSWPWPREAYAHMIEFFSAGNPQSIAFDIIYSEPSIYGSKDDEILAKAEKESGKVIQTIYIYNDLGYEKVQLPIDVIKDNAAMLGNITSLMDSDDIIRRGRLDYTIDGKTYPTLGTAPIYLNNMEELLQDIPRLEDGSVLLRFSRNIDYYHPFWAKDILESYDNWKAGKESFYVPEDFEGAYIFTAYYAPGLFDICSTPVSQVFPGVGIHIITLDNILHKSFIKKTPNYVLWIFNLLIILFGSYIVTFASTRKRQGHTVAILIVSLFVGVLFIQFLSYFLFCKGIWFQLICPLISFLVAYLVSVIVNFTVEGKQKRLLKSAFSQCLSKEVVNEILQDPSTFTLGGKEYYMTAVFTDIEKFSTISELLTIVQLEKLLNFYLTQMTNIVLEEKGTIDKYEGDAIIAMFGAPIVRENHAYGAVSAAVKMKKAEIQINNQMKEIVSKPYDNSIDKDLYDGFKILVENNRRLFTRIGINSGEMIAGYFGSELKKNYTMMGSNVNLASRLEGVNKQYQTDGIIISEETANLVKDKFLLKRLDKVRVVNVNTPIQLYEVVDFTENTELASYVERWNEAMDVFQKENYSQAKKCFEELLKIRPQDCVAEYYLTLIKKYFIKGNHPTIKDNIGVEWNPDEKVFTLLQK